LKKLADKIKRVGLLANSDKVSCRSLVRKAATLIQTSNRAVWSDANVRKHLAALDNANN